MIIILISLLLFSGVSVSTPLAVVLQWTWNILRSAVQLSSGEDSISVLGKSHMCSALSLKKEVGGGRMMAISHILQQNLAEVAWTVCEKPCVVAQ